MTNRRVSVVIPTYNRAYCLPTALGSLQKQTYTDWEALVIDDGSKDNTEATVKALAEADPRIRYHRRQNGGVSAARNTGLDLAEGAWIGFLDSDDAWEPWKLSAQVACFDALPQIGMVWTDMNAVDAEGTLVSRNHLRKMYGAYRLVANPNLFDTDRRLFEIDSKLARNFAALTNAQVRWGDLFSSMIFGSLVHTSTVLLSRERLQKVGRFEESYRSGEDYDFHLRTCREGPVALLDAPGVIYRIAGGDDQLTAASYTLEMAMNALSTRERAIAAHRSQINLTDTQIAHVLASANRWIAEAYFERNDFVRARRYYRRSRLLREPRLRLLARATISHLPAGLAASVVQMIDAINFT
jgi:GT2 family glycosyltransferase